MDLNHKDNFTLVIVDTDEYGNKKLVVGQHAIKGTYIQDVGFLHTTNQDIINSDGLLYPNEKDAIVKAYANRLEGMYVIIPMFGSEVEDSWFKITRCAVARDHLLTNKIDNIQCVLKKSEALEGVS